MTKPTAPFPAAALTAALLGLFSLSLRAQDADAVRELGTTITGNEEQPKVLYIVPWKSAQGDGGLPYQPISAGTDAVFQHFERHEHRRHLEYVQEMLTASQ